MKPFVEDLRRQLQEKWTKTHRKLGIKWDDLEGVPSGEVAIGVLCPAPTESVPGRHGRRHRPRATNRRAIAKDPRKSDRPERRAPRSHGTRARWSWSMKSPNTRTSRPAGGLLRQERPAGRHRQPEVDRRRSSAAQPRPGQGDTLASLRGLDAVTKRGDEGGRRAGPRMPAGSSSRLAMPMPCGWSSDQPRKKGTDMLKILKEQGFTAIRGPRRVRQLLGQRAIEILHRTFVFAPGSKHGVQTVSRWPRGCSNSPTHQAANPLRRRPGCRATWPAYAAFNLDYQERFREFEDPGQRDRRR